MFEPKVFQKQMYCIEESTCDIVGTFRRLPQSFGAPPPQWIGGYWGYGRILKNFKTCVLRVKQTSVGEKCLHGCTSPNFGHFTVGVVFVTVSRKAVFFFNFSKIF